jgi:hypothetical protein
VSGQRCCAGFARVWLSVRCLPGSFGVGMVLYNSQRILVLETALLWTRLGAVCCCGMICGCVLSRHGAGNEQPCSAMWEASALLLSEDLPQVRGVLFGCSCVTCVGGQAAWPSCPGTAVIAHK